MLILSYMIQEEQYPVFVPNFKMLGTVVPEKIYWRKSGQIKGIISMMMLSLSDTIQQVIPNVCTKFQNPRCSNSLDIFDEKSLHTDRHTNIINYIHYILCMLGV